MKKILLFLMAMCCVGMVRGIEPAYLSDGACIAIGDNYMEENIIRAGDVPELKEGTMTYDPVNHVLTLANVLIESSTAVYALGMTCSNMADGNKKIEIRFVGSNYIKGSKSNGYAFMLGDGSYTITGLNGKAFLMSNSGIGLILACDELTVKDGVYVYAGYSETGMQTRIGAMPFFAEPVVNVDCATLNAFGTENCMAFINPNLNDAEETNGFVYNSKDNEWKESDGTTTLKNKMLTFAPTKHIFWMLNTAPEGGTITVTKNGSPISSPYRYGKDEENNEVDIEAIPNEGWEFGGWRCVNGYTEKGQAKDKYGLPELSQTGMLIGYFRKTDAAKPTKPWYLLSENYEKIVSIDDWSKSPTVVSESFLSDMSATKLKYATYAEGRLYYLDQEETTKTGFYSVLFDPSTGKMSDVIMEFNKQGTYQKFYCLTYNMEDEYFYGVATKSDGEQYLVKINFDTNVISSVGKISNTNVNNSVGVWMLAANSKGELYGIFRSGEQYSQEESPYRQGSLLCKIDKSTAAITPIGWTGMYFESQSCSMAFDYKTDELIATNSSNFDVLDIVSIDVKTGKATRLQNYSSYCNGIFQLLPERRLLTVGVKSGQEYMGTAVILENGKEKGKFLPGDEVDIEAFKKTNEYRFVKWNDGSTENARTITISDDASANTYTAEFGLAEGIEGYPVWIGNKQWNSAMPKTIDKSSSSTYFSSDPITDGSISYDAETKTLTMNDLKLNHYLDDAAISIVGEKNNRAEVTINLVGTNTIIGTPKSTGTLSMSYADVKVIGSGKMDVSVLSTFQPGIVLEHANLTFEGVEAAISGNMGTLLGMAEDEVLTIRGAKVSFNSSVEGLGALNAEYCSLTTPTGAAFNTETHQIEKGGSKVSSKIEFTPWNHVRAEAEEDGTGKFIIKSDKHEFENVGWFEKDEKVTITAVPAEGFEFARWKDDILWGDEEKQDQWIGETREFTMAEMDYDYTALFYYSAQSDRTWYGVNNGEFISFEMSDRAAHPQIAKTAATSINAGEYRDGSWEYMQGTSIKSMPFDGLVDKEELSGKDDIEEMAKGLSVTLTDMAYDLAGSVMYGVDGSYLYRIDYSEEKDADKVKKLGEFEDEDSNTYSALSIAINASSEIYVLSPGSPNARLLRVLEIDEEKGKVRVEPVGEDNGNVGKSMSPFPQSMAFDLATGELFWGDLDYLRIINTETAKTYICGDLGRQKGAQGFIRSLHNASKIVKVTVKLAEGCEDMGTVSVNNGGFGAGKFIAGQKATITATANDGYTFLYWQRKGNSKEIETAKYSFSVSSNVTYIAYFKQNKKPDQGLETLSDERLTVNEKILIDGQLYIIRDGKVYNANGIRVK